jgi:hypothetical protein
VNDESKVDVQNTCSENVMTSAETDLWVIAGAGAVTPIGTSVAQTAASLTAKLRRFRRVSLPETSAIPFTISEVQGVTTGMTGLARLQVMLQSALEETTANLPPVGFLEGDALLVLALPDELNEQACRVMHDFALGILRACPTWAALTNRCVVVQKGAAGGFASLDIAYKELARNPNLTLAIIAGADSRVEPTLLNRSAKENLILQKGNQEGYVASEAAAATLLTRRADIPAGRYALMRPSFGEGEKLWPRDREQDGSFLQPIFEKALQLAALSTEHISHWLSDSDGSIWRGREEHNALDRLAVASETGSFGGEAPEFAIRIGQVGAAWAPLIWGLTDTLARYEVSQTNAGLTWTMDPKGMAGAAVIVRSPSATAPNAGMQKNATHAGL